MLQVKAAEEIVQKAIPQGKIQAVVVYGDLYLFQVFTDDPFEGDADPFYSVNRLTGEFRDFSIITDGDISEIVRLFTIAKQRGEGK